MPSGPRPPARPGSGPGRGKTRARPPLRPGAAAPPRPASPSAPDPVISGSGASPLGPARRASRLGASLTTRAIALVVVLLVLTISYASSLRIYFAQAHEIASTRAEIGERQQKISDLQGELGRWGDADYVRTQARQRLGWVVPGETGYQVVDADGNPLGGGAEIESSGTGIAEPQDAWWAELWGSVATADKPAPAKPKEKTITARTEPADGPR
ncbi:Cell division protein FtsB [Friedmanniella luteola]|uniref:Cell division protein FtsB n=1 Tax=Friedmanniella luteola TaxID=546871 RepID=A0A1H1N0R1_9ACTN|nr:septum formation initiator family protein [Friedmanniella luteola]SDR92566.1 Cell division protein FtsB [Friedmanniella luteola]